MFSRFLYRNIAPFLVFLTLVAFSWICGGSRSEYLQPVMPWLWALACEALFFFPQRHGYEDVVMARHRVWGALVRDPVTWCAMVLLAVLVLPLVNHGLCPICDYPAIMAGADPKPLVPFAPFCVNIEQHYAVVVWFVPALTATLAVKHALLKDGKRAFLEMAVWNSAALVVLGFVQQATGATAPLWEDTPDRAYFFSSFGYPNKGGSFFAMSFALAFGLWRYRSQAVDAMKPIDPNSSSVHEQQVRRFIHANYAMLPMALCFFGALCTLSRAAILLSFVLAGLGFLYVLCEMLFSRRDRASRVRRAAVTVVGGMAVLVAVNVFAPSDLGKELDTLSGSAVIDRVSGKAQYHTRVATEIFKAYPFFGVGGWGYRHFCIPFMREDELKQLQTVGGTNVHNDYLQFLAEHGAVGAGALFAAWLLLALPIFRKWGKLYKVARFSKREQAPPRPTAVYSLPAPAFWIVAGCAAVLVHAFGDCPMRSPAVLTLFMTSLACADGFMPREEDDDFDDEDSEAEE